MLVANKKDKVEGNPRMKEVSTEEGMRRAEEMGARYIETSAFTGECVNEAFETFIREVRKVKNPPKPSGFSWPKCTLL